MSASTPRSTWVCLGDKTLPLERLRAQPEQHPRLFEAARAALGHGLCLCTEQPLRLVIRLRAGRYHLAGWPGEGTQHNGHCPFFKLAPDLTGLTTYSRAAIEERGDTTAISLRQPLDLRPGERDNPAPTDPSPATSGRNTVSLLGLLHWLWEQAGLNRWHAGDRSRHWRTLHAALVDVSATCSVNQRPLTDALHTVAPYQPHDAARISLDFDRFASALGRRDGGHRRGLFLGEIREITPTVAGHRLAFRHTRIPVFTSKDMLHRATRSYPHAFAASRPDHSRQIALVLVEKTDRGNLGAVDMCAMLANRDYIPADSAAEVHAADHLIARGRAFIKPCRYEAADAVFPDFVLTDADCPDGLAYFEVWGLTGHEEYERRRSAKERHYARSGATLIGWDVTTTPLSDVQLPPIRPVR